MGRDRGRSGRTRGSFEQLTPIKLSDLVPVRQFVSRGVSPLYNASTDDGTMNMKRKNEKTPQDHRMVVTQDSKRNF